ncbi:hypothetical protein D9757_009127 [Collybiopsis confluens]|uniref:Nephrocystin 3-like N-terminal domain-containing protein n=1 Tax=Collybiopsis confluens TaxID=2823264 RepID=A0A8H5H939_9AGAR|nr:hypothetical protein D9757_009127 [Collybiopsis confluens]
MDNLKSQMFAGSHGFLIQRSTFQNIAGDLILKEDGERGLLLLHESTCPAALFNAEARCPPPRCHDGTRKLILDDFKNWIDSPNPSHDIRWLYGPAGAGKSAIAQTLAETCSKDDTLAASFFFWRGDSSRNNPRYFFTTIAYRLAISIPELRPIINAVVLGDSSILTSSIETQFDKLIAQPCAELQMRSGAANAFGHESSTNCRVVIVDGLDECLETQDQLRILSILGNAMQKRILSFRILISSRSEPRIKEAFYNQPFGRVCLWTSLDNNFQASRDIRRYLQDQFPTILNCHSHTMDSVPRPWPTPGQIERLVEKASGQFVYPSTVLKYINDDGAVPADRLNIVLGLTLSRDIDSPFAELDALYRQILLAVTNKTLLLQILGVLMVYRRPRPFNLESSKIDNNLKMILSVILQTPLGVIRATLSSLHSLFLEPSPVESDFKFCHASFRDFLLDPKRSKQFFIGKLAYDDYLARFCLDILINNSTPPDSLFSYAVQFWEWHCSCAIPTDNIRNPSPELVSKLFKFDVYAAATQIIHKGLLYGCPGPHESASLYLLDYIQEIHETWDNMQKHGLFLQQFHDISVNGFCLKIHTCRCIHSKLSCPDPEKHQEYQVSFELSPTLSEQEEIGTTWEMMLESYFKHFQLELEASSSVYELFSLSKNTCPSVEISDFKGIQQIENILLVGWMCEVSAECGCSLLKIQVHDFDLNQNFKESGRLSTLVPWCQTHRFESYGTVIPSSEAIPEQIIPDRASQILARFTVQAIDTRR